MSTIKGGLWTESLDQSRAPDLLAFGINLISSAGFTRSGRGHENQQGVRAWNIALRDAAIRH